MSINRLKRSIRHWWQRIRWGFDDSDTWSLDMTIARFIRPRLGRFMANHTGMNSPEWQMKLAKMYMAFDLLSKDRGALGLGNSEEERVIDEGLALFCKHFRGLWW